MAKLYHIFQQTAAFIDTLIAGIGRSVAYLSIFLVLVTCFIVLMRYGFNVGSIAIQETATYMHASLFTLGAAYTFQRDAHVRVDVFFRRLTLRQQAWVNIMGAIFLLLPTASCLVFLSYDFVAQSWVIRESSIEQEGLPFLYLLKSLIPIAGVLLFLQGVASLLHNTLALVGYCQCEDIHDEVML